MKPTAIIAAVLLTGLAAFAQTATPQTQTPPSTTPQSQSGATNQAPGAAQAQTAPPASHKVLQAGSQEELKAYQDAFALTDPDKLEAAANDFSTKYPNSQLRASLYIRAMNLYAQSNNTEKVIDTGRQAIAADPTNPIPLVQVASALAESTRESDIDRDQRMAEAAKDAHAAIDNIETGLVLPANADPARVEAAKRSILTMAYDTLGMVDLGKKDYTAAVTNLQQAISKSAGNPEAVLYLRLSVAQDNLKQYPQALDSANKAVQYAKDGSQAQNLAKMQQARLQKLMSAQAPAAGAAPPSAAPAPSSPPNPSSAPTSPSNPH
jgi:tetratricopeptide (TPR) repeat protein